MTDISLYSIEEGLAQLLQYRQERMADKEDPATPEELEAIEGEIRKYEIREPAKVTGVVAMFRQWKAQRANIKAERDRLRDIDRQIEANEKRLKEHVAAALELLPEPKKGCRTLIGLEGSKLMLKSNGGVGPLQVDGWDSEEERWTTENTVLPDEYETATVRMPLGIFVTVRDFLVDVEPEDFKLVNHAPDNTRIRKALAEPCETCAGIGEERSGVCHCGESMEGYHDNHSAVEMVRRCESCDGTGKRIVPGARLLPRGQHVEAK